MVFQQNNSPIHTTEKVKEKLKTQIFETIVWLTSSPDIKLIE